MYFKSEKIIIDLDGMRFTSFQTALPQLVLDPIALTGWYDGVDVRRDITVRPTSWGDFSEGGRMAARTVAVSGTAVAKTAQQLGEMRDKFTSLLADGGYKEISIEDASGKRYSEVGLEGAPVWLRQSDTVASWRISLYAPDPRIFGATQRVNIGEGGGDAGLMYPLQYPLNYSAAEPNIKIITNDGNTEAWPQFKVTGIFPKGFTITNGKDREVSYSGPVTQQAPVIIDMAQGTATQSGVDKTILMGKRQWFSIPPKGSIRPEFKASASVTYSASTQASPVVNGVHRLNGVDYRACAMEDSKNCFWDAKAQGNGLGRSFTNVNGTLFFWDELAGPVQNVRTSGWCDIIYRDTWI